MKQIFQIKLSELTVIGFFLLLFFSCGRDPDCSECQITEQEKAFLSIYNQGDISVFKNDSTNAVDTLTARNKGESWSGCSDPCSNTSGSLSVGFASSTFSKLNGCTIIVGHNSTPMISYTDYFFPLSGTLQAMTINSTTYNDIYLPSIDSSIIDNSYRNSIPWKIAYSKSKGFLRFYMINGQTWSKL